MLAMVWHVLSNETSDQALGGDCLDRCDANAYRIKLSRKLQALGRNVAVEPVTSVPVEG
jgi:hypothetical protein